MTTNSFQLNQTATMSGLGTFTFNIPATGLYTLGVESTIPYEMPGSPQAVANPAAQQVTNITLVADSSGSLNSKFFLFGSAGDLHLYYVWYNINSAGVDPAVSGRTGIEVTGATGASASTLAGATRTAIAASAAGSFVSISGATSHVIITNRQVGSCTAAANGSASPGFSYSVTQTGSYGTSSGLNIVVNKQGSAVYSLTAPSTSQPSMGGSVNMQCAANDVVTVVLSSLAPADALANAVKTTINLFKTQI